MNHFEPENKILVVDDEYTNLRLVEELLIESNYDVTGVMEGKEAIQKAETQKFDLILLDIMMPDVTGLEVCKILNEKEDFTTPIILVTALDDRESPALGFEAGAVDYIRKPFIYSELMGRIKTHIELKKSKERIEIELEERKKIEKDLVKERNQLRTLIDNSADLIYVKDNKSRFVVANNCLADMVGAASPTELIDKNDYNFFSKEIADVFYTDEQELFKTGIPLLNKEEKTIDHEGKEYTISTSKVPLKNNAGEIYGLVGIGRNITKEKIIHEELKRTKRFLEQLLQSTPSGIFSIDSNKNITLWNNRAEQITGYTESEIIGKKCNFLTKNTCKDTCLFNLPGVNKTVIGKEYKLHTKDNKIIHIRKNSAFLEDNNGKFIGGVESFEDITPQKEAEISLKNNLNFLNILIDTLPNPMFYKDVKGNYLGCNSTFANEILGLQKDKIFGKNVFNFSNRIPYQQAQILNQQDIELLRYYGSNRFEARLKCSDKLMHDFIVYKSVYLDVNKNPAGIVGIMLDITERKNTEKRIKDNLKVQRFLSEISNTFLIFEDFNSTINSVLNVIGKQTKVSRISIYENFDNGNQAKNTFEWTNKGNSSLLNARSVVYRLIPTLKKMLKVQRIINATDVSKLPMDLYEFLRKREVKSFLTFPLYVHNNFYGFLSFEENSEYNSWEKLTIETLRTISVIISNAYERMISDKEIKESEEKFRTIFYLGSDAMFITDINGKYLDANSETCKRTGYSTSKLKEMTMFDLPVNDYANITQQYFEALQTNGSYIIETEYLLENGRSMPVEISGKTIYFHGEKAILHISRDLTERKQMERKIMRTIIETEEKERTRFAKDLHDGLGSLLSSINIYINMIKSGDLNEEEKISIVNITKSLIDEAILSTKEIANNLRPTVLSQFGLIASVKSFCEKINATGTININFKDNKLDHRLNEDIEIILFRVINELINNTLKHASAKNIDITIINKNQLLILQYHDDGIGFNLKEKLEEENDGMGLYNIMSRINTLNGNIDFQSKAGKGVNIEIKLRY